MGEVNFVLDQAPTLTSQVVGGRSFLSWACREGIVERRLAVGTNEKWWMLWTHGELSSNLSTIRD